VSITVRIATAEDVQPLRRWVLRPHTPPTDPFPPEHDGSVHVAAYDGDRVVGVATVFPQPWPGPPPIADAWRLRGMAVEPSRRGSGVGRLVLAEAMRVMAEAGASLAWANARSVALAFYEAAGWVPVGDEFVTAETGMPHRRIIWTPQ
jgi:GNAT superfamily N-acetyltransferase